MELQIYLDETPITEQSFANANEAMEYTQAIAAQQGKIVIAIEHNGEMIQEDTLAEIPMSAEGADPHAEGQTSVSDGGGEILVFHSSDPFAFVKEVYVASDVVLQDLINAQTDAADDIQRGETEVATGKVSEIIEMWLQIQQAVSMGAALLQLDLDQIAIDGGGVNEAIEGLTEQLVAIRDAMQTGDWVALSDSLGYEMGPVTEQWRGLLKELIVHVDAAAQAVNGP